jgi:hypothetical protein
MGMFDNIIEKAKPEIEAAANEMGEIAAEEKRIKDQQAFEKKRIQKKQIRALRNNFRPAGGFLQGGRGVSLGESTGLPSKLGTA